MVSSQEDSKDVLTVSGDLLEKIGRLCTYIVTGIAVEPDWDRCLYLGHGDG